MNGRSRTTSLSLLLLSAACGGGGGGGAAGGSPPTIHIDSPAEGHAFTVGTRTATVTGTGTGMVSVVVKLNGTALSAASVTSTATTFTASLTLSDNANTIEALANNSQGSASSGVVHVTYPFARFSTFQGASVAIGQPDFTHGAMNQGGTPGPSTLAGAWGDVLVRAGSLYVPDYQNNRVLVFDSVPTTSGAAADLVLGQPDFTTVTRGTTASKWDNPFTVAEGGGKLLVDDVSNSRVLILNAIPGASGPAADVAVGQADLTSDATGCTAASLYTPQSIFTVGGRLIVADSGNNRVLVWNAIPTAEGAPADLVLGQADFTHCTPNAGAMSVSALGFDFPTDVWSDGTRLAVADHRNNRVLVWKAFPTANGAPADLAVGQPDLVSNGSATTQTGLLGLYGGTYLASNGNQLFVADWGNNRVLVWNTFPTASGAAADVVLGQGDFTHGVYNDDNTDGTPDTGPSARTLFVPSGLGLWGGQLFVADAGNYRYLIFDAQ